MQQGTGGPVTAPVQKKPAYEEEEEESDEVVYSGEAVWPFHLVMLCASAYLSMLLTDWGTFTNGTGAVLAGDGSMWVKFSAQLLTILLFTWTLIAPGVLKGRDF